jgi:hypothetical protein
MRGRVALFTSHCTGRLPVRIKFWRSAFLKKAAAILETCPKSGTGGYSISPSVGADLGANHNAQEPPGSDVGDRKGIQAAP